MINRDQFADLIRSTLEAINLYSEDAVYLLMGTAAQESRFGHYLKQIGTGPARGFFQIEPDTEKDNWENYLRYRPTLARKIINVSGLIDQSGRRRVLAAAAIYSNINPNALGHNLVYDICMARVKYRRAPGALPSRHNLPMQAAYWKEHYNTNNGRGTVADFMYNYRIYVE